MNKTYDTIIIGTGPAGYTAGIYAARREMNALLIGKEPGGQVMWASEIENYPGFKSINNYDFISKLQDHTASLGVEIKIGEVKKIEKKEDIFMVYTEKDQYATRSVIAAMGLTPRRLAIPGEAEYTGKGVSYCANCDSPFYRGKKVAVVGGGNSAFDAAEILSKFATDVYLIHRSDQFRAFEALVDEVRERSNIKIMTDTEIKLISGSQKVERIQTVNRKTGAEEEIALDGIFIEIGRIAATDLLAGFADRDDFNQILVDEKCRTKTPGLFAAGDVTNVPFKQITIAEGQATIAALAAYEYLQIKEGKKVGTIVDRSLKKKA